MAGVVWTAGTSNQRQLGVRCGVSFIATRRNNWR